MEIILVLAILINGILGFIYGRWSVDKEEVKYLKDKIKLIRTPKATVTSPSRIYEGKMLEKELFE